MLNPYIIIAAIAALIGSMGLGFYNGQSWANTKHEAARAQARDAYQAQLDKQRKLADDLSDKLAKAEGRIVTKTIEVIKYVDRYTTGRDCLSYAATGLLNNSIYGLQGPEATRPPVTEDAGAPAATDRDVYLWIAQANQYYDTCSARLTALVDFELVTNPAPAP